MIIPLLFCVVACQKDTTSPPDPEPNAKPVTKVDRNVKLISNGAEPRHELRYHPPAGTRTPLGFAIDLEMHAGPVQGPLPTFTMDGTLAVVDASPDGNMRMRMTIDKVDVLDRAGAFPAAQVRDTMRGLEGLAIEATCTPSGQMSNPSVDATKVSPTARAQVDQLSENLQDFTVQLPDEPVGIGAQWDVTKRIERNALHMTTTAHITLEAIEGDRLTFKSEGTIGGPDQTVAQNGISLQMKEIRGTLSGSATIDLGSLVTTAKMGSTFHAKIDAGGQSATSDMAIMVLTNPNK